jgi:di/tricarboxylate transporter
LVRLLTLLLLYWLEQELRLKRMVVRMAVMFPLVWLHLVSVFKRAQSQRRRHNTTITTNIHLIEPTRSHRTTRHSRAEPTVVPHKLLLLLLLLLICPQNLLLLSRSHSRGQLLSLKYLVVLVLVLRLGLWLANHQLATMCGSPSGNAHHRRHVVR